MDCKAWWKFK